VLRRCKVSGRTGPPSAQGCCGMCGVVGEEGRTYGVSRREGGRGGSPHPRPPPFPLLPHLLCVRGRGGLEQKRHVFGAPASARRHVGQICQSSWYSGGVSGGRRESERLASVFAVDRTEAQVQLPPLLCQYNPPVLWSVWIWCALVMSRRAPATSILCYASAWRKGFPFETTTYHFTSIRLPN
jgi:hypothetical protein